LPGIFKQELLVTLTKENSMLKRVLNSSLLVALCFLAQSSARAVNKNEQKAIALFERFVNLKDKGLSWECFALELAELARQEGKGDLAALLKDLSAKSGARYIGGMLKPHRKQLPKEANKVFARYEDKELEKIFEARIALNGKVKCHTHKKDL
jgi:hypothetical protein